MLTPNQKRNIQKIIPFGIVWIAFSLLYVIIEKGLLADLDIYPATGNPYSFTTSLTTLPILGLIMGLVMGSIEVLYLSHKFSKKSFGTKIITKNLIYVTAICVFLIVTTFVGNSIIYKLPPFHPEVLNAVSNFLFTSFVFWSIVLFIGAIVAITLFISEISDNLGQGILRNFFTGKYHKPRIEKRIFMFLDMKSSTTIAEKMGHVQYYELLNEFYADVTKSIMNTSGKIYQYVGDEVVVSWNMDEGLHKSSFIRCFFDAKRIFTESKERYINKYGFVPEFKAGFHFGDVTIGEIGVVKKEVVFTGDVLNTTARIQGLCNTYKVDLLVSGDLLQLLSLSMEFTSKEIGECELRGREKKIQLYTIIK